MQTSNQSKETKAWIGIWIAGISGSGKSNLGGSLAMELGCPMCDSDDEMFSKYIIGHTPRETADAMAAMASRVFAVWTSLDFPSRSGFLKVGLSCPARVAIARKSSGYSAWINGGSGGQVLDNWMGLEEAHIVLDATRPTHALLRAVKEMI